MRRGWLRMPPAHVVAGSLYVLATAAVAAVAAWPIYRSTDYIVLVVVATLLGAGIAIASTLLRWAGWVTVAVTAGTILVAGTFLAVPAKRGEPGLLPSALLDVIAGSVTGWKDLVTVDLPVGSYRNLLVPALIVFLVGTAGAMVLAWRRARIAALGAVVALAMVFFGLAFGRTATSAPIVVGPLTIPAPVELLTGALGLVLSLGWLAWLALDERRQALRRAADTTGVRMSRRRSASDTRRGLLAGAMLAVAVVGGAIAAPAIAAGQTRDVLRSGIGPDVDITQAEAPLSTYRADFADPRYGSVLFRVSAVGGALPERIRIATLTSYDGTQYRALDGSSSVSDARFVRVPSSLDPGAGTRSTVRVTVEALDGIWLPTFGQVASVSFEGADAARLADGFYYNASSGAGVETSRGGLRQGDAYTVTGVTPATPALDAITAPGASGATVAAPESLVSWVQQQDAGTGGAALSELISRLRARGYLSHALSVSTEEPPTWVADLGGYAFQPSASGHSLSRVDALFRQLLARQSQVDADGGEGSLVAAIGDDEQFAVAGALIAQQLGFPARVVMGVRLSGDATDGRVCRDGECTAGDLSAWVEVQASTGQWVAVDVTPQHTDSIDNEVRRQRDPENPTDVRPESAKDVVPPNPVQQDSPDDATRDPAAPDLSGLWLGVRVSAGIALALALAAGPFAIILGAKAWRRRARREETDAATRVVGGWDEYVDAAVDHGLPAPRAQTRTELAAEYDRPAATGLALAADRAVFSDGALSDQEVEEFWRIVDAERRDLGAGTSIWRRIAAAVSLKSFTRSLSPRTGRGRATPARRSERRKRRRDGDAQST